MRYRILYITMDDIFSARTKTPEVLDCGPDCEPLSG